MSCESDLCVGDPKCGSKTCENGGNFDDVCECICPDGYTGTTCSNAGEEQRSDGVKSQLSILCAVVWILTLFT
ncbi:hypothetical protein LSH36_434g00037 [Paralvinella palmiformis]|uniref:EGF-like domain-containing protein n=1 Tax=Paralvinella palmiformis TaxID=53620 RepID=A0AAD9MZG0_9ANNE|nr:hypothetical protein LSH36_434g00037 [Paralvinella palmiformis]